MSNVVAALSDQPADLAAIAEFSKAMETRVSDAEFALIANDLALKSARVKALFSDLSQGGDRHVVRAILSETFISRRKLREIEAIVTDTILAEALVELGDNTKSPIERASKLRYWLDPVGEAARDLPFELLHFLDPQRYCLATSWVWNPITETGAIKLLLEENFDLFGDGELDDFVRLDFAIDYVTQTAKAAGHLPADLDGVFAMDTFLAGVYAIYMSTVLEMRMTKEFNKILPPLNQLMRRLLGIYRKEVN